MLFHSEQKGISAAFVSDKETTDKECRRGICKGEYQLIFVITEALFLTTELRGMLSSDVYCRFFVGFIVDEAHCVKKWYVDRHYQQGEFTLLHSYAECAAWVASHSFV